MPNIVSNAQFVPDYGSQEAEIKKRIAIAEAIRKNVASNKPPDMAVVGGHVIRNNPWAGVLSNITGAVGDYQQNQAIQDTGNLEDKKRQALIEAVSGSGLNVESLAKAGVNPEEISKFAIAQQLQRSKPATWHQVFDKNGKLFMQSDRGEVRRPTDAETGQPVDFQGALYDPSAVYEREQAKGSIRPMKSVNEEGREVITTPGQANPPAYGKWGQPQQPSEQPVNRPGTYQPQQQAQKPQVKSDMDYIMQAMDNVVGPGTSAQAQNGNVFSPTHEQEIAIDNEFKRLKSLGSYQGNAKPGEYQGIRGPSIDERNQKDIEKTTQLESQKLPIQKELEAFKTDENIRQKAAEQKNVSLAPLPQAVLQQRTDLLDEIALNNSINADLGIIKNKLDNGELNLGLIHNLVLKGKEVTGSKDPEVVNYANFITSLNKLRNDSLRLNKGVQTESDAKRAWDELIPNLSNPTVVKSRLEAIQNYNLRAAQNKKNLVNAIQENYGKEKYDFSQFENQPSAIVNTPVSNDGWSIKKVGD